MKAHKGKAPPDHETKSDTALHFCKIRTPPLKGEQGSYEVEGRGWSARERTINARTKQYLEESYSVKVEVEELEDLLGPEDVDVDFRRIMKEARDERGRKIFETFSSDGPERLPGGRVVEMGQKQKEHHGDKIRRLLQGKDGGEKTRNSRQSVGDQWRKMVDGCSGRLFGKLRPSQIGY